MYLRIFIASVVLVALVFLVMGIWLWLSPGSEFPMHPCTMEGNKSYDESCDQCEVKDIANCNLPKHA